MARSLNAGWHLPVEVSMVWDTGKKCCQAIHLNLIMEVSFPMRTWLAAVIQDAQVLLPLSLVVSVSGKNSPGSEGMQEWWWWAEGLLFGLAHVFHLLGNSYGSLCNHHSLLCATTWLLCCAVMGWGLETRWGFQNRARPQSGWRKPKGKYTKLIVYQSCSDELGKKGPSAFEGLQSFFSLAAEA